MCRLVSRTRDEATPSGTGRPSSSTHSARQVSLAKVNTVSPGSFLSEGMRAYLESLPIERGVDTNSLEDAMRVIDEDFGHPAFLPRAGDPSDQS